jgi:cytochrome c biogenesis protein CcmG/thiol:disulfide interchange protein DsbE
MGRERTRTTLRTALVGAFLVTAACTSSPQQIRPTAPGPTIPGTSLPASPTALPAYSLDQFRTLLTQLHGRPVLVNFWATWCGPCVDEAPALAVLARAYGGKVQFVGVDIQDSVGAARAWVRKYGWTYPSVADPTKAIENGLGFIGQPVTVVYDASGTKVLTLAGSFVALQEEPKLRSTLDALT